MSLRALRVGYVYGEGTGYAVSALSDVTVEVSPGDLLLVLGRTGSGKSTLLRILAGLQPPGAGSVEADGRPPGAGTAGGSVGMVFQDPESQLFGETVLDDVRFGPANLGRSAAEALSDAGAALEAVGLAVETFGERSPFTLSGGEARRAAIAGVLAMRPRYLLMDEPTAGLDAHGRRAIRSIVSRVRSTAGVVVVSHDAEEWLPEADSVLMLDEGATVYCGSSAELVASSDLFAQAGLAAPGVLRAWGLAAKRGMSVGPPTCDPHELADRIAAAKGRPA